MKTNIFFLLLCVLTEVIFIQLTYSYRSAKFLFEKTKGIPEIFEHIYILINTDRRPYFKYKWMQAEGITWDFDNRKYFFRNQVSGGVSTPPSLRA